MFKKLLATVGIGAAKVDTVLQTEHLQPGQMFAAEIIIQGGEVEQSISGLELALMTSVKIEGEDGIHFVDHVIESWHISDEFELEPGELKTIAFEARLHSETPITELTQGLNQSRVWLATGLNVDMALDPTDKDPLFIYPNEAVRVFMQAMEESGFKLVKADVEQGYVQAPTFKSVSGCYQELEYEPQSFSLFGIKELELTFIPEAHRTHVLIEIDRAFREDGYIDMTIEHDQVNLSQICDQLDRLFN